MVLVTHGHLATEFRHALEHVVGLEVTPDGQHPLEALVYIADKEDDIEEIKAVLIAWVALDTLDVILTTGGTGFSPRDITPEATQAVIDRMAPGLAEAMRANSLEITQHAMLSRAVTGVRGKTLIINLPGSPKAVKECLEAVLPAIPHGVEIIKGEVTEHHAGNDSNAL